MGTNVKVEKVIKLEIEADDYEKFKEMIDQALAYLADIDILSETNEEIKKAWEDKLEPARNYAVRLLDQISS